MSDFPIQVERLFAKQGAPRPKGGAGNGASERPAASRTSRAQEETQGGAVGDEDQYSFEVSGEWWESRQAESELESASIETPFCFEVRAAAQGEAVEITGELTGCVALECSRCAKRYSHPLRESFRLVLESAKSMGRESAAVEKLDPEGAQALAEHGLCLGEDLEAGWYKGPVIGLDDFLGEVIALSMPLQPLCSEACPGVCPHCGAERVAGNRAESGTESATPTCDCEDEKIESPFAVLAALKTNKD